ncbi:MAG: hypothetical protein AB1938_27415 [Myxococcota bacterium]
MKGDDLVGVGLAAFFVLVPALFLAGFIALVIFLLKRAAELERQRTLVMQQYATRRGWAFTPGATTLGAEVSRFKLFSRGSSQRLTNAMRGEVDGQQVALVDFRYTTGSGKSRTTHQQTVCAVRVVGANFPHVYVRRQLPFFDALGRMLGGQDFDFPDDEAFSRAFVVQTSGAEAALRSLLKPQVRAHLHGLLPPLHELEAQGEYVLLHFGQFFDGPQLDTLVANTLGVARVLSAS